MAKRRINEYPLTELHGSGYEVATGEPDVRGWKAINGNGLEIGEVVELIFDPLSQSVRYLVLHIEGRPLNLLSRNVLVPIGLAELLEDNAQIAIPSILLGQLAELPTYKRRDLDYKFERAVRKVFTGADAIAGEHAVADEAFYTHDHFNQDRFYSQHIAATDQPVIRERIVPKQKPFASDQSTRTPAYMDERSGEFRPFRESEIELTEHKEVPVVNKTTSVKEEVHVNRDVDERDETVRDTVRRTEVDVDRFPPRTED